MDVTNLIELAITLGLEIWLLVLLARRGVYRHLPLFVTLVLVSAGASTARLSTSVHYRTYFYVYWWSEAIVLPLGLVALNELFHSVYKGFFRLRWFKMIYYGTIAVVVLVTSTNAVLNPPVQAHLVIGLILGIGIAVNLLQLCIAALFGALANPMGIGFWRYPSGIAAGLALSAMGPAVGYFVRSVFGKKLDVFTQNASAVAYILALVIWVATFAWPEPETKAWKPPVPPEEMLRIVRGYLRAMGVGRKEDEP